MRALLRHDEWIVPLHQQAGGEWHATLIQDLEGQHLQLVFTDEQGYQDGLQAVGQEVMGGQTVTLSGVALFGGLADEADLLSINWNSPPQLFFKKTQFQALRRWAATIGVERTLATPKPDLALLKHFDNYSIVLQKVEGGYALMLAPDAHGRRLAAVFTAEDTLDAFLKSQPTDQPGVEPITRSIAGELLFDDLKDLPLDGICFNPTGPVPKRMFTAALSAEIMKAT